LLGGLRSRAAAIGRALTGRRGPVIEVLVTDAARRRALTREVREQLGHLRHALGADLPVDAIVVQQSLAEPGSGTERAGYTRAVTRRDGRCRTVMVLALEANGRRLSADHVLSALAIQAMALVEPTGATELASVTFASATPAGPEPETLAAQAQPRSRRPAEGRRAMLELIHGTAPLAPTPHVNGQDPAPLPSA
jgi:hypothetical protein